MKYEVWNNNRSRDARYVTTSISRTAAISYFILYILYFNTYILSRSTIHVILARHKGLPEDDVLTSKHVGANPM